MLANARLVDSDGDCLARDRVSCNQMLTLLFTALIHEVGMVKCPLVKCNDHCANGYAEIRAAMIADVVMTVLASFNQVLGKLPGGRLPSNFRS